MEPRTRPTALHGHAATDRRPSSRREDLCLHYGYESSALFEHLDGFSAPAGHGADRSLGLRQIDAAALPEPDERPDRRRLASPAASCLDGRQVNDPALDVIELRRRVGMVLPAGRSLPQVDLRERGLRPADRRRPRPPRAGRGGGEEPSRRGALGRGERPPARFGAGLFRRPAPAAVHRPGHRRPTRR